MDKAFADAAAVVEGFFTTPLILHHPLETHGNTISWKEDGVTCWASTQGTGSVRDELASIFELKKSQVRVITEYMGGGFGAKFGASFYGNFKASLREHRHNDGRKCDAALSRIYLFWNSNYHDSQSLRVRLISAPSGRRYCTRSQTLEKVIGITAYRLQRARMMSLSMSGRDSSRTRCGYCSPP